MCCDGGATNIHLVVSAHPSCGLRPSSLEITFYGQRESHVYLPSRDLWPERARWITTSSGTTGGKRKPHTTPQLGLTWLKQVSPEQSIFREIKRLIVRPLIDAFGLGTNEPPGGTIIPPKRYYHSTRYVPIPPTKYPPDRSQGIVYDEGKDRHSAEMVG